MSDASGFSNGVVELVTVDAGRSRVLYESAHATVVQERVSFFVFLRVQQVRTVERVSILPQWKKSYRGRLTSQCRTERRFSLVARWPLSRLVKPW